MMHERTIRMGGAMMLCLATLPLLPAQAQWQMQGGRMRASVVVPGKQRSTHALEAGEQLSLRPGKADVHFSSNADGKPMSLQVETRDGSRVAVAIGAAGKVEGRKLDPFDDEQAYRGALVTKARETPIHVQTIGAAGAEMRDYRLTITVEADPQSTVSGLVARHHEEFGCYLFSVDWPARKIRLERWMGTDHMIVRQVDAPWLGTKHTLALQVDGFRLQAFVDDEVVLQSFDGALGGGAPGVAWVGEQPELGDLMMEPVAAPLASAVSVQDGRRVRLQAVTNVAPGHLYVLELALDRPHPWVPRSPAGCEPYLDQPWAAPTILWGDWRNSLGSNTIGEVGVRGEMATEVVLPDLPALRLHYCLARSLLVSPDGESIVGVTPSVLVAF